VAFYVDVWLAVNFNMLDIVKKLVLHKNQATESGLVDDDTASKWNKYTLRENWVVTMSIDEFHGVGQFLSVCLIFFAVFNGNLDGKFICETWVAR
jgi:hypothetical protein